MFTLKIKWFRLDGQETVDESTLFIKADQIQVGSLIESPSVMKHWESGSYFNYQVEVPNPEAKSSDDKKWMEARLIQVEVHGEKPAWYLASMAWLLGPDGKTIERLI